MFRPMTRHRYRRVRVAAPGSPRDGAVLVPRRADRGADLLRPDLLQPDHDVGRRQLIWVVNPGGDNVAVIGAKSNRVLKRIKVGDEPQGVAVDPNNRYAYVANAAGGNGHGDPDQEPEARQLQGRRRRRTWARTASS